MNKVAFVPIDKMPDVVGVAVPSEVYWILQEPAPLLGMARPSPRTPWGELCKRGVRHVVCLTSGAPDYDPSPLSLLCALSLQDLYGGAEPVEPTSEAERVARAAQATAKSIRRGEGVVVHCAGGTGRTGTVLGATLVILGVPVGDAVARIQSVNRERERVWPESPWQERVLRNLADSLANCES